MINSNLQPKKETGFYEDGSNSMKAPTKMVQKMANGPIMIEMASVLSYTGTEITNRLMKEFMQR